MLKWQVNDRPVWSEYSARVNFQLKIFPTLDVCTDTDWNVECVSGFSPAHFYANEPCRSRSMECEVRRWSFPQIFPNFDLKQVAKQLES